MDRSDTVLIAIIASTVILSVGSITVCLILLGLKWKQLKRRETRRIIVAPRDTPRDGKMAFSHGFNICIRRFSWVPPIFCFTEKIKDREVNRKIMTLLNISIFKMLYDIYIINTILFKYFYPWN